MKKKKPTVPTGTWKKVEARIAEFFGARRTPLSGGNSGHTRSDSLHKRLFIEAKHRKKFALVGLAEETRKLAAAEGKIPVVAVHQEGQRGFYLMIRSEDLEAVWNERKLALDLMELERATTNGDPIF